MKRLVLAALAACAPLVAAQAQTALQPGLWEITDKTTLEGAAPIPPASRELCLKGDEATLERVLYPAPEQFAKHGCTFTPGPREPGLFKAKTVCPANDTLPEVTAEAEVRYKPESYEGLGQLLLRDRTGATVKGSSVLTGKRLKDC
jgi:hypothetical protein